VGERPAGPSALNPVPVEITRENQWDVSIRWSDGHAAVYPALYLRRACCCAVCVEGSGGEGGGESNIDPEVHPLAIHAVGTYAIQFEWSDGHAAGVYPYDYLRGLCPCPECRRPDAQTPS
jgi:DUF971 family protein